MTVSPPENGKTVTVSPGTTVRVVLKGGDGTGYHWLLRRRPSPTVLAFASEQDHVTSGSCATRAAGCPDQEVLTYRAAGPGRTRISLLFVPPGRPRRPVTRFGVSIVVK